MAMLKCMIVFHSVGCSHKISSYFLFLLFTLFGVKTQILLPSLPARRREVTINFLLLFSVKSQKHWLPSPVTCEVRKGCLFQRSAHRGVRKNCVPYLCMWLEQPGRCCGSPCALDPAPTFCLQSDVALAGIKALRKYKPLPNTIHKHCPGLELTHFFSGFVSIYKTRCSCSSGFVQRTVQPTYFSSEVYSCKDLTSHLRK